MPEVRLETRLWYALQVRSQHERVVIDGLDLAGIESFYPTYTEEMRRKTGRRVSVVRSLFTGYMFARFDASTLKALVESIAGVIGIVSIGLMPAPIPDEQIQAVRNLLASPLAVSPCPFVDLKKGEAVEIKYGSLQGTRGTVIAPKGKGHVLFVISIQAMNRSLSVTIPREQLRPVGKAA
jgi:transcription antitermination factor NusG